MKIKLLLKYSDTLMSELRDQYKDHYGKFYFSNWIILFFVDGVRGFGGKVRWDTGGATSEVLCGILVFRTEFVWRMQAKMSAAAGT